MIEDLFRVWLAADRVVAVADALRNEAAGTEKRGDAEQAYLAACDLETELYERMTKAIDTHRRSAPLNGPAPGINDYLRRMTSGQ